MAAPNQSRNITVVGGSGTVGAPILSALIAAGHKVSVLTRPESNATFPGTAKVHTGDYSDEEFVASALKGQDALIMALNYNVYAAQIPLIKAAAKAGVPYIVPAEFGSDATHPKLNAEIDLMNVKAPFRKLIEDLGVSSWIGVTNNPWVEFSMRLGVYGIDLKNKTMRFFDDGNVKANFTTLTRVGETLAALFALPEEELEKHKNAWLYTSSFYVSQRDLLASAARTTGTKEEDWAVSSVASDDVIAQSREAKARGDMMGAAMALFALVFKEGYGGDYNAKVVDYKRFGLEPEELDEVMKSLAKELA
ncbi:Uu.00g007560.m01.CDS01 [Anthostomella pinea]|uniref:Uu.00g007560.m01.CDS01 n=1 Tax=Anthostomella pinea TaxID=933095 RepID=A0AAI8VWZ6_9PEZI|nr:Uu.00g007560.m01.CDS01 [Anthostomella pinea]